MKFLFLLSSFVFFNDLVFSQNVGIGTIDPPTEKLEVVGRIKINNDGYGLLQTNNTVSMGTYIGSNAGWVGTFSDHPLWFFTHDSTYPTLVISNAGNVAIGNYFVTPSAKLEISSTNQGFLPPRMTGQQRNLIISPAQGLMVYCTNCGTGGQPQYYNGTAWVNMIGGAAIAPDPAVGDPYGGGIIAYLFQPGDPGYIAGQFHGLIAAAADQTFGASSFTKWSPFSAVNVSSTSTDLGTGNANTDAIVSATGLGNYAAKSCADLVLNSYSDWYLPSRDELSKLYNNKDLIGGFSAFRYWSSSQFNSGFALGQNFTDGVQNFFDKSFTYRVRAIRSF